MFAFIGNGTLVDKLLPIAKIETSRILCLVLSVLSAWKALKLTFSIIQLYHFKNVFRWKDDSLNYAHDTRLHSDGIDFASSKWMPFISSTRSMPLSFHQFLSCSCSILWTFQLMPHGSYYRDSHRLDSPGLASSSGSGNRRATNKKKMRKGKHSTPKQVFLLFL